MSDQTIVCPKCGQNIQLTEAMAAQMRQKIETEQSDEHRRNMAALAAQKETLEQERIKILQGLEEQKNQVVAERAAIEESLQTKLREERAGLMDQAKAEAKRLVATRLEDLEIQNREKETKLAEARDNELVLRKQARALEEQKKNIDLELARKIDEERSKIIARVRDDAAEETRMKMLEKDKQLEMLKRAVDDAQRKAEQGSMQIQGEVQEQDLKEVLSSSFPLDEIADVPTGTHGADLIQSVKNSFGQHCGIILWESKNTKAWSAGWLKKLKDDQGLAKADICVLVSKVLPDEVKGFGLIGGIWVADYSHVLILTQALRYHLANLHQVKNSVVGRDEKMEYLYNYLSGNQFKHRMENIVGAFSSMQIDLQAEKRSMQRIWSKREKEIERVVFGTSGMYGDLQGIIGASLPTIQSLEAPFSEIADDHLDGLGEVGPVDEATTSDGRMKFDVE